MIVQVYEIQTAYEAELVLSLGVDHVGSVIVSESRWKDHDIRSAIKLTHAAGKKSSLIPLFSDEISIGRCIDFYKPDIVHFCESITVAPMDYDTVDKLIETQKMIRRRFPEVKIMRSIPIPESGESEPGKMDNGKILTLARKFESCSDYFLTDTIISANAGKAGAAEQPVAGFVGITGRTCDWDTAACLVAESTIPVILAGGIGPANVKEAVLKVRPHGVDSCTATNARDVMGNNIRFKKDPEKVSQFITAAHTAAHSIE